jgi:hypothetical protein
VPARRQFQGGIEKLRASWPQGRFDGKRPGGLEIIGKGGFAERDSLFNAGRESR